MPPLLPASSLALACITLSVLCSRRSRTLDMVGGLASGADCDRQLEGGSWLTIAILFSRFDMEGMMRVSDVLASDAVEGRDVTDGRMVDLADRLAEGLVDLLLDGFGVDRRDIVSCFVCNKKSMVLVTTQSGETYPMVFCPVEVLELAEKNFEGLVRKKPRVLN